MSEALGEGTAAHGKIKTLPSTKSDMYWHLQIKLSEHEIFSLENKIPGETQLQEPKQDLFSPALI